MRAPWREVTYIEERRNAWWLTLSCGHLTSRKRPVRYSWTRAVGILTGRIPLSRGLAPKRVRCQTCPVE